MEPRNRKLFAAVAAPLATMTPMAASNVPNSDNLNLASKANSKSKWMKLLLYPLLYEFTLACSMGLQVIKYNVFKAGALNDLQSRIKHNLVTYLLL